MKFIAKSLCFMVFLSVLSGAAFAVSQSGSHFNVTYYVMPNVSAVRETDTDLAIDANVYKGGLGKMSRGNHFVLSVYPWDYHFAKLLFPTMSVGDNTSSLTFSGKVKYGDGTYAVGSFCNLSTGSNFIAGTTGNGLFVNGTGDYKYSFTDPNLVWGNNSISLNCSYTAPNGESTFRNISSSFIVNTSQATCQWLKSGGDDLVLRLDMNENDGNTVYDSSGYGNNGTIHGATWTTGKFGSALSFDGENDYVDCGNDSSLDITDAITIEAWVYDPPPEKSESKGQVEISNLEELKIKQIKPDKFAFKSLSGDLIEIGEQRHSPPQPYLKLNKWNGEVFLKVDVPYGRDAVKILEQNNLKYVNHKYDVEFYPKEPEKITEKIAGKNYSFTINSEGGVEFDVILKEKPDSNVFEFPIETQGLKFYYQPPLHPEHPTWADTNGDGKADTFRPENVVGSYAVYHATKKDHIIGQKNYRAGKAFHIYRPKIIDAKGNWVWGKLNVDVGKKLLTIEIPKEFLDNAVYPIRIDPVFGYTSIGSSQTTPTSDIMYGSLFTSPADAASADSISVYTTTFGTGDERFKGIIVLHSSMNIITDGIGDPSPTITNYPNAGWFTSNFSTPPSLSPNTEYVLMEVINTNNVHFAYYDTGDTNQGYWDHTNSYASPQDPTDAGHNSNKYSIYCTYTAATPEDKIIIGKGEDAYEIQIDDSLNLTGYINNSVVSTTITKAWHHIALTYNGSEQRLYVDGILRDNKSLSGSINTTANNLTIGKNVNGTIDEVRIYNRALSESEILQHYLSTAPLYFDLSDGDQLCVEMNVTNTGNISLLGDVFGGQVQVYNGSSNLTLKNETTDLGLSASHSWSGCMNILSNFSCGWHDIYCSPYHDVDRDGAWTLTNYNWQTDKIFVDEINYQAVSAVTNSSTGNVNLTANITFQLKHCADTSSTVAVNCSLDCNPCTESCDLHSTALTDLGSSYTAGSIQWFNETGSNSPHTLYCHGYDTSHTNIDSCFSVNVPTVKNIYTKTDDAMPDNRQTRGYAIKIFCNASDKTKAESDLTAKIYIKKDGESSWLVDGQSMSWDADSGDWLYTWDIPDDTEVGWYTVMCSVNNGVGTNKLTNETQFMVSSIPGIYGASLLTSGGSHDTGGWGESFNFTVNVTEPDGDTVNVSLWLNMSGWFLENSTTTTAETSKEISFVKNDFTCDNMTMWHYKFTVSDGLDTSVHGINETSPKAFTVEQDDITATVCESSRGQTVQTRGLTKINLTVRIYDADRDVYLDGVNGTIWVSMNNTASSWDGGHACVTTNGNCTIEFDPDCDYKRGTQYFIGGTTGNTCYKNANTTLDTSLDWIIIDATPECAYTVEIQLGFNISGPDSDIAVVGGKTGEGIYYSDNITRYYVCSYDTDIPGSPAFGLVFSGGKFYYIELENQTTQYLMKMSQELAGNKFIVPITPGTCSRIESKMNLTPDFISGPFSAFAEQKAYPVLVTLSYPGIDIVGDEEFGQGQFSIVLEKNETGNITQIIVKRK